MIVAGPRVRSLGVPTAVALAAALGGIAAYLNLLAALAVVAALAFVVLLTEPRAVLPILIVASALDRYGPQWGDANIRLDLLVALLAAGVLANRMLVRTVSPAVLRSPLVLPLVAYAGANLFSTVLFAAERTRGLKLDVEIWTAILTFVLASALLRRRADLTVAMKVIWIVTVGEAVLGLMFVASYSVHLSAYGVSDVASGFPATYGTMWEPNVYGSFLAGNFFLLLADYYGQKRHGLYTSGLIIVTLGIVASLTRTVWIACMLGAISFFIYLFRTRRAAPPNPRSVRIGILGLALATFVLGLVTPLGGRLIDIVNLNTSSAHGRLIWFREAITEWSHAPLFGLGTGSWTFDQVPGGPHAWLPSLFLLTLHDTGLLGLGALLWAIWVYYRITIRGARGGSDLALLAFGSIVGFSCLLIAFQTTTGFWFAYPWIVMVIGTTAARLSAAEP
jgi:O-Antigen ligase